MHVAVLGAGALGRAYAATLSRTGCKLTLVTRHGEESSSFWATQVGLWTRRWSVEVSVSTSLPDCDAVLVTVRAENVDQELLRRLGDCDAPAIVLTPVMSEQTAARWQELPRAYGAMASLLSEAHGQDVEFLVPPVSRTLVSADAQTEPGVVELVRRLKRAGVGTKFVRHLERDARATNLAFFPLQMAAAAVPDMGQWPARRDVLAALAGAQTEARRLAAELGRPDLGVRVLAWICSSAWRLAWLLRLAPVLSPFVFGFLQHHFGQKLPAQTALFTSEVRQLAASAGLDEGATQRLLPPVLAPRQLEG